MANLVGPLIKEARTKAKLSQEALAAQIEGLSASDVGRAERGEKELTQSILRQIAKATGVTQASLINAAKESSYGAAGKKTASGGSSSSEKSKTAKSKSTAKKSQSTAKKSESGEKLTAAEKKLVELYRAADSETKKAAVALLKGEKIESGDLLSTLLGSALEMFGK